MSGRLFVAFSFKVQQQIGVRCEFSVATVSGEFAQPLVKVEFKKTRSPQEVKCKAVQARYVRVRVLSEVNGGPWASIAELGVVGK